MEGFATSRMFEFSKVQGIIFDLDDTLVKTSLDFCALKKRIDCPQTDDILAYVNRIDCPSERRFANHIIKEYEIQDAKQSTWVLGAHAFVKQALYLQIPLAIVTRNCREATKIKLHDNQIPIDLVLTREDAAAKPDPEALLIIATQWRIDPKQIAYIGDYIYDVEAAHNANMQAWLFDKTRNSQLNENSREAYTKCLSYIVPPQAII